MANVPASTWSPHPEKTVPSHPLYDGLVKCSFSSSIVVGNAELQHGRPPRPAASRAARPWRIAPHAKMPHSCAQSVLRNGEFASKRSCSLRRLQCSLRRHLRSSSVPAVSRLTHSMRRRRPPGAGAWIRAPATTPPRIAGRKCAAEAAPFISAIRNPAKRLRSNGRVCDRSGGGAAIALDTRRVLFHTY